MKCSFAPSDDYGLRMSRSFGDFYLKSDESGERLSPEKQAVSSVPDVLIRQRSDKCEMCALNLKLAFLTLFFYCLIGISVYY